MHPVSTLLPVHCPTSNGPMDDLFELLSADDFSVYSGGTDQLRQRKHRRCAHSYENFLVDNNVLFLLKDCRYDHKNYLYCADQDLAGLNPLDTKISEDVWQERDKAAAYLLVRHLECSTALFCSISLLKTVCACQRYVFLSPLFFLSRYCSRLDLRAVRWTSNLTAFAEVVSCSLLPISR